MLLMAQMPETHGLQVIYKSMEDYEKLMGEIRNDANFTAFREGCPKIVLLKMNLYFNG